MTFLRPKTDITQITPAAKDVSSKIDGAISAAFIASGIGCFVLGLMTTGAVISEGLKALLVWSKPAGPLSGKTGVAVIAFLVSWALLHSLWNERESSLRTALIVTLTLIGLGFLLTFPPVFEAFE